MQQLTLFTRLTDIIYALTLGILVPVWRHVRASGPHYCLALAIFYILPGFWLRMIAISLVALLKGTQADVVTILYDFYAAGLSTVGDRPIPFSFTTMREAYQYISEFVFSNWGHPVTLLRAYFANVSFSLWDHLPTVLDKAHSLLEWARLAVADLVVSAAALLRDEVLYAFQGCLEGTARLHERWSIRFCDPLLADAIDCGQRVRYMEMCDAREPLSLHYEAIWGAWVLADNIIVRFVAWTVETLFALTTAGLYIIWTVSSINGALVLVLSILVMRYCYRLCLALYGQVLSVGVNYKMSALLHRRNCIRVGHADQYKETFRRLVIPAARTSNSVPVENRPHLIDATSRTQADKAINKVIKQFGLKRYDYQASRTSQARGVDGCRTYCWGKDALVQAQCDPITDDHCLGMIDVDYYLDDTTLETYDSLLITNSNPVFLYSLTPTTAASETKHCSFHFLEDGQINVTYEGASTFTHKLWDYSVDNFTVIGRKGLTYIRQEFSVERVMVSPHRSIIMLLPIARYEGLFSLFLAQCLMPTRRLQRFNPVVVNELGAHVSIVRSGETPTISLSLCTPAVGSVELSVDDFTGMVANLPGDMRHITASTVETRCKIIDTRTGTKSTEPKAGLLAMALKLGAAPTVTGVTLIPVQAPIRNYQFISGGFDYTEKASMVEFMAPLITGATIPTSCAANDARGVSARVTDISHKLELPPAYEEYVAEFVDLLIPAEYVHTMTPTSLDDVLAKLKRPTQRKIFEEGLCGYRHKETSVASFVKREAGQTLSDPRIISTTPAYIKTFYSTVTLSIANFAKTHWKWYAFGKTPKAIAQQLANWCMLNVKAFATQTDFSRFDGRISSYVRTFEQMLLMRAFSKEYHCHINELHSKQYQQSAKTRFGTKYQTLWTRLSGSPETSIFNTMLNALIEYVAQRINDSTRCPREVFDSLGLKGGDDGVAADLPMILFTDVAAKFGLKLTGGEVKRGEPGLKFLARSFGPGVWLGDPNSCCDFVRTLSKFGLTVNLTGVTPRQKLICKAEALRLTDPNTPYIKDFVERVAELSRGGLEVYGPEPSEMHRIQMTSWWSKYEEGEQFPNYAQAWMIDEVVAEMLARNGSGAEFLMALSRADTLEDLLSLPAICHLEEVPAAVDVMVNRVLVPAGAVSQGTGIKAQSASSDSGSQSSAARSAPPRGTASDVRICMDFQRGNCTRAKCKFLHKERKVHSVEALSRMAITPCNDFLAGTCTRATGTCRYKH